MTLNKRTLRKWLVDSTPLTDLQKHAILDRFGSEPDPYEWSEQDIFTQIQNYLYCGHWEKPLESDYIPHPPLFIDPF